MLWSASNFFCGAAVVNRLLAIIGNTIEARDEDGGWDGRSDFFRFLCPPWPCWWMDGGEGELNKLPAPPTTIPGITIGVCSTWLVICGDPTGGTNSSSGFKPAALLSCVLITLCMAPAGVLRSIAHSSVTSHSSPDPSPSPSVSTFSSSGSGTAKVTFRGLTCLLLYLWSSRSGV